MRSPMCRIDASSATAVMPSRMCADAADRRAQSGERALHLPPPRAAQLEPPRPLGRRSRGAVLRGENPSESARAEHEECVQPDRADHADERGAGVSKDEVERDRNERERDHLEEELRVDHEEDLRGTHPIFRHDQVARRLGARLVRRDRRAEITACAGAQGQAVGHRDAHRDRAQPHLGAAREQLRERDAQQHEVRAEIHRHGGVLPRPG